MTVMDRCPASGEQVDQADFNGRCPYCGTGVRAEQGNTIEDHQEFRPAMRSRRRNEGRHRAP